MLGVRAPEARTISRYQAQPSTGERLGMDGTGALKARARIPMEIENWRALRIADIRVRQAPAIGELNRNVVKVPARHTLIVF